MNTERYYLTKNDLRKLGADGVVCIITKDGREIVIGLDPSEEEGQTNDSYGKAIYAEKEKLKASLNTLEKLLEAVSKKKLKNKAGFPVVSWAERKQFWKQKLDIIGHFEIDSGYGLEDRNFYDSGDEQAEQMIAEHEHRLESLDIDRN